MCENLILRSLQHHISGPALEAQLKGICPFQKGEAQYRILCDKDLQTCFIHSLEYNR